MANYEKWCFYINLPLGAAAVFFIAIFFTPPSRTEVTHLSWKQRIKELDLQGTAGKLPRSTIEG